MLSLLVANPPGLETSSTTAASPSSRRAASSMSTRWLAEAKSISLAKRSTPTAGAGVLVSARARPASRHAASTTAARAYSQALTLSGGVAGGEAGSTMFMVSVMILRVAAGAHKKQTVQALRA